MGAALSASFHAPGVGAAQRVQEEGHSQSIGCVVIGRGLRIKKTIGLGYHSSTPSFPRPSPFFLLLKINTHSNKLRKGDRKRHRRDGCGSLLPDTHQHQGPGCVTRIRLRHRCEWKGRRGILIVLSQERDNTETSASIALSLHSLNAETWRCEYCEQR